MIHFVIGGDGYIGAALCRELKRQKVDFRQSTRRKPAPSRKFFLDLSKPPLPLPYPYDAYVVYIATTYKGATGSAFQDCQCDPVGSWQINVDAPIAIARYYARRTPSAFIVYLSSSAAEYSGGPEYGRQKAQVEAYMNTIDAAIIRASRVTPERLEEFAKLVVSLGEKRRAGLTRWEPWPTK
jgi:nucleoside-diphosphate-sugar epimerase